MRIIIFSAITLLLASQAAADGKLMKYRGLSHYTYDYKTGEITRVQNTDTRRFNVVWDISTRTGYFFGSGAGNMNGVWGDMDPMAGDITTFRIGYSTNSAQAPNMPGPIGVEVVFYDNDNGRGDLSVVLNTEFSIDGLSGVPPEANLPNQVGTSFVVDITGITPFSLTARGADEDVCGLGGVCPCIDPNSPRYDPIWEHCCDDSVNGFGGYFDFGYTYLFRTPGNGRTGPMLVQPGEPNMPCPAPGATNNFDLYNEDPNNPVDPNRIVHKAELGDDQAWFHSGTFFFGGDPFAGFYLTLSSGVACDNPACDDADINADCVVDLRDLAIQLGNFATPRGAVFADGDLDGDGDVDLTDLAVMLSLYGDDCR